MIPSTVTATPSPTLMTCNQSPRPKKLCKKGRHSLSILHNIPHQNKPLETKNSTCTTRPRGGARRQPHHRCTHRGVDPKHCLSAQRLQLQSARHQALRAQRWTRALPRTSGNATTHLHDHCQEESISCSKTHGAQLICHTCSYLQRTLCTMVTQTIRAT